MSVYNVGVGAAGLTDVGGLRDQVTARANPVERLTSAWAESIALRGYSRTTVQHIVELSGLSRSTLYTRFGGKEEAFVAIHAVALARFAEHVETAGRGESAWPARVAAGIGAALQRVVERRREAQLLLGDQFAAGPRMGYAHELLVARFGPALAAGRVMAHPPLPSTLESYLIGSVVSIAGDRLRAGEAETLPALAPSLTEFVLTPYIGSSEARRVAREWDEDPARSADAAKEGGSPEDFPRAFESAFARLRERLEPACAPDAPAPWPPRVAAGVRAAFAFAVEDPEAARLLTFGALSRGAEGQAHHERLIAYLVDRLRACRDGGARGPELLPVAESAIVGGVALLVAGRLHTGREAELPDLADEAVEFVLTPYIGSERARQLSR